MVGRGKKPAKGVIASRKTKSARADLQFPVGRIERFLRRGLYARRIGSGAAVFLAAVLEYLTAEVLDLAGDAAWKDKKQRIGPRHIFLAVKNDTDICNLFEGVTISEGGVLPNILPQLVPKKTLLGGPST
ncbi:PREDICTED: histone H2A, sperm-like [Gekko japonicus]|uniref:Histone H2A n=1 Tax=Gekko japonicus TaxID=146911 RepID=A0ABM1LDA5_GEKJA|nr:PREDICTED: histone H2A, sperm-like [Gekko japonicus]